jgi:hypothetical protein
LIDYLFGGMRPTAKTALHEIRIAETKREAQAAFDQFLEI